MPFRIACVITLILHATLSAGYLLVPMDDVQTDHLKAYGFAYKVLEKRETGEWLLNYRAGSFLFLDTEDNYRLACEMGVRVIRIGENEAEQIFAIIEKENMERIILQKAPSIAVYTPEWTAPWDDAVTIALTYAEIPYEKIWDKEVLSGALTNYDWVHLHHEDFTGQYNKFWSAYNMVSWYKRQVALFQRLAREAGFETVREHKAAVARMIQHYVAEGGFLFIMCTATETIDVALALSGTDFIAPQIDGTPIDPAWKEKIDYTKTFAFEGFEVYTSPIEGRFSDIDFNHVNTRSRVTVTDFELYAFSAKIDPVSTMLNQNHERVISGFYGLTTSFRRSRIKDSVTILGDTPESESVRYIHANYMKGHFTFYGGHDPEDESHYVGDLPTDLSLHKNSPGYRLILNNILFPAAKKEKRKT